MQGEFFYGTDGLSHWNDVHAAGYSDASAFSAQETSEMKFLEELPHLDISNSNRYLDKYLFYFSSKL